LKKEMASKNLNLALGLLFVLLLGAGVSRAQAEDMGMDQSEAELANEIHRRLITAALHKRSAEEAAEKASAPAPMPHHMSSGRIEESDLESPALPTKTFSDSSLPTTDKLTGFAQTPKNLKGPDANFPVKNVEQLRPLSDAEMFQIFHKGTAEIPSAVPGQKGMFPS
jgi:hypothetical protein